MNRITRSVIGLAASAALVALALPSPATPVMADRGGGNPGDRVEYVVDEFVLPFGPLAGFEDSQRGGVCTRGLGTS